MSCESSSKVYGYTACFEMEIDSNYTCPICLLVLRDATQTRCGHRFCEVCINRVIGNRKFVQCPVDRTWLIVENELFEDEAERREILSLLAKCKNHTRGCLWKGELRSLQDHESTCSLEVIICQDECGESFLRRDAVSHQSLCPFRKVQCHHCKTLMKFVEIEAHDQLCPDKMMPCEFRCGLNLARQLLEDHVIICPKRVVKCEHCHISMMFTDLTKHQLLSCSKILVTCTLCKRQGILREDIQKHVCPETGDCPDVIITCSYANVGCTFQNKRRMMCSHYATSTNEHLQLAVDCIHTMSEQLKTLISDMQLIKATQDISGVEDKVTNK